MLRHSTAHVHGRGRAAPLARHQGRDRAGHRGRLLLRLRVRRAARRERSRAHRGRDARDPGARPARLRARRHDARGGGRRASAPRARRYKVELAEGLPEGEAVTFYEQDGFVDLCRGPHLQTTKPIRAFKLTSLAGAYWRGDSDKPMLTRIYGTAFFDQAELDAYLERIEEARRRDHRRLGRELDLFHLSDTSPGSPFWHPRGMVLFNELGRLWRELNASRGYQEVRTPILFDTEPLEALRALGQLPRQDVPDRAGRGPPVRPQADELPGPRRDLQPARGTPTATCRCGWPSRGSCTATRTRARCTASCACATSRRTTRTSSAAGTRSRTRSSAASSSRA